MLSIDDYKKGDRVFVKNLSNGQVLVDITLTTGKAVLAKVPKTFIPIELTSFAPLDALQGSSDLRITLQPDKNLLRLVDTKKALQILKSEDAVDEQERLNTKNDFVIEDDGIKVNELSNNTDTSTNIRITSILIDESLTPKSKLLKLKALFKSENFGVKDLKYIYRNSDDIATKKWAKRQLKM